MALTREDLRNQLIRRDIRPVYLLFGPETHLRDLAAKTIADFAFAEGDLRDFNETEFSLNTEGNLQRALAAAEQLPMMASRRVIRITDIRISASGFKDTIKDEHEQALKTYLSSPAPASVVIFIADELNGVRKMSKLLKANTVAVEFEKLKDDQLMTWARNKVDDLGCKADEKVLAYLVGLVGRDVRRLTNEIKKLATAALPDTVITSELIESLVPNSRELSNFELTDHLVAKNKTKALEALKKILDDGGEPLMILGLIAGNFRRIFLAKEMMLQGIDRREVANVMRLPYPKQEDFLTFARRTEQEKLTRIIQRIAETDLAIKTSIGGGGPIGSRMQIELLVCELATI